MSALGVPGNAIETLAFFATLPLDSRLTLQWGRRSPWMRVFLAAPEPRMGEAREHHSVDSGPAPDA
jgi:hypothetical protein